MSEEWTINLVFSRKDGGSIAPAEGDDFFDDLVAFLEERGLRVGGSFGPHDDVDSRYAEVGFKPSDVVTFAREASLALTEEEARAFLARHENGLHEVLWETARQVIVRLLQAGE